MGAGEDGTLSGLKAIRKELIDLTIAQHRGRIVKTTGDGIVGEEAQRSRSFALCPWPQLSSSLGGLRNLAKRHFR